MTRVGLEQALRVVADYERVAWDRFREWNDMRQSLYVSGSHWQDCVASDQFTDIDISVDEVEFSGRDRDNDGFSATMPTDILYMTDVEFDAWLEDQRAQRILQQQAAVAHVREEKEREERRIQVQRNRIFLEEAAKRGLEVPQ